MTEFQPFSDNNWMDSAFTFDEIIDVPTTPSMEDLSHTEMTSSSNFVVSEGEVDSGCTTPHSCGTIEDFSKQINKKPTTAALLAKAIQKVKNHSLTALPSYSDEYYQYYPISSIRPIVHIADNGDSEYVEYYHDYQYNPNKRIRYEINFDETLDREYQASYASKIAVPSTHQPIASRPVTKQASPVTPATHASTAATTMYPHNPKSKQAFITSNTTSHPLLHIADQLCAQFNQGHFEDMQTLLDTHFHPMCAFLTKALDREVFGTNYILQMFRTLYDAHPDAVHTAHKARYVLIPPKQTATESSMVRMLTARAYFAGTRILPSSIHDNKDVAVVARSGEDENKLHRLEDEYLFKRPTDHIVDTMDVSKFTSADIAAMYELERTSKNICVFCKGMMKMYLEEQPDAITGLCSGNVMNDKIVRLEIDMTISSFQAGEL